MSKIAFNLACVPWRPYRIVITPSQYGIFHLATPDFMLAHDRRGNLLLGADGAPLGNSRSLFTFHDPFILCGTGATQKHANSASYVVFEYTFLDAPPPGYKICEYCERRIRQEFLPYASAKFRQIYAEWRDTNDDAILSDR